MKLYPLLPMITTIPLILLICALCSLVYWTLRTGISPMPTSAKAKACFLHILPPLKAPGNIYELGSGWGTLALALAKHYPEHTVIGYELSPIPYLVTKLRAKLQNLKNLKLKRKDYHLESWDGAQLVVCYLYPKAMEKLKAEFHIKLRPGTWVISNTFAIPGWIPYHTYEVPDLYHTKIYAYKVP
jgi:hypothetical protein